MSFFVEKTIAENKMIKIVDNGGETADRYTVLIGKDCWHLSENADAPNGVCMYGGEVSLPYTLTENEVFVDFSTLPFGVQNQIKKILIQG